MNRYWDLSEKERSALSRDDVQAMLRVELMEQGVLQVAAPELQPVENVKFETTTYYIIKKGSYSNDFDDFVFRSVQDAEAFLKLPILQHHRGYSSAVAYAQPFSEPLAIQEIKLATTDEYLRVKQAAEKDKAAKDVNDKLMRAYNEAVQKLNKACDGVWTDWADCRDTAQTLSKVVSTYNEYIGTCEGNAALAAKFLAKAFDSETIHRASEWFGIAFSAVSEEAMEAVEA